MNLEKPPVSPPVSIPPPISNNNGYLPSQSFGQAPSTVSDSLITYNHITYALAIFSYFTAGLTWIVPIFMNYLKRDEARGTWLYSHFDWQIKTFWYSIFFGAIAAVMMFVGFGGFVVGATMESNGTMGGSMLLGIAGGLLLAVVVLWHLYRIIRGWIALANRRPVP